MLQDLQFPIFRLLRWPDFRLLHPSQVHKLKAQILLLRAILAGISIVFRQTILFHRMFLRMIRRISLRITNTECHFKAAILSQIVNSLNIIKLYYNPCYTLINRSSISTMIYVKSTKRIIQCSQSVTRTV